jgi:hypothetical protein
MWIHLTVGQNGFSIKVLNIWKRKMSNRKTEIKMVDQFHREGRTEGRKERRKDMEYKEEQCREERGMASYGC